MSKFFFNIFYAFLWTLTLLPLRILYVISDFFFIILFWIIRYRRKVVWENLNNAFPEKTHKEKRRISRRFFRHLCDYFFETMKMIHMSEKEITKRVGYTGDYFKSHEKNNINIVGMMGHSANWEWLASIALKDNYHWAIPYHPLSSSPYFDQFMKDLRGKFSAEPVPMMQTYKRLMQINQEGRIFHVAMVADQSPPDPRNKHWLTFMNQETAVMEGSERIARKTGAAVMYCKMIKIKRGYYKIDIIPITDNIENEDDFFVTKRYYELLEEHIHEQPEYWLWSHRRWKHKPQAKKTELK